MFKKQLITPINRLLGGFLLLWAGFCQAAPDVAAFLADSDHSQVTLSPDGKHLALIKHVKNESLLLIIDSATNKAINQIYFDRYDEVGSYRWANNKKLLISLSSNRVNNEQNGRYGEIYAIDLDADKGKFIFGYRSMAKRRKVKANLQSEDILRNESWSRVIDTLKSEPNHVMILAMHWQFARKAQRQKHRYGTVYKLNIETGKTQQIAEVKHDRTRITYDEPSDTLWARAQLKDKSMVLEQYDFDNKRWQALNTDNVSEDINVIAYSRKNKQLIVKDYCGNDTLSYCLFNPADGQMTSMISNPAADLAYLFLNAEHEVFAVSSYEDYQKLSLVNKDDPRALDLINFNQVFAGNNMTVHWQQTGNERVLLKVSTDVQPAVWYIFDRQKNKMQFVAQSRKAIVAKDMNKQYPFAFKSKDQKAIHGYVTLPKINKNEKPAAVVLIHGGPFGVRDKWQFDSEVQLLSAKGYAVIQVNYRGSSGFGRQFEKEGFGQMGGLMQQDILQAVDYLVKENIIDGKRVCAMGGSFGAYSAIQGALIAPETYQCIIARSGVYDWAMSIEAKRLKWSQQYWQERVGSLAAQKAISVVNRIENLKAPLLLVHGEKDRNAPLEQSLALKDKLKVHQKPHQWVELDNEGHYFYNQKNRIKYFETVLAFLQKHNPV